jgi:hypothetical protein
MLDTSPTTGKGPLAQRMAQQDGKLRIGKADPLGFGSARKDSRIENGIEMTGGKSLDAPTRGVYREPKKQW